MLPCGSLTRRTEACSIAIVSVPCHHASLKTSERIRVSIDCMQELSAEDGDEPAARQLRRVLSMPAFDVLDECDELLASKFQLVYAWGAQGLLPALAQRVHMLQAVLQTLQLDTTVTNLLADRAIAHVRHHVGHYGGVPEVRLLPGASRFLHCPPRQVQQQMTCRTDTC